MLRISVISGNSTISVSGPPRELCLFREQLSFKSVTTFAYVHAWYHGGEGLESAVLDVVEDIRRQKILFPSSADIKKPVRSTLDGSFLESHKIGDGSLAVWAIRHLLVHCVDWSKTSQSISETITDVIRNRSDASIQLLSFGPSSEFLLADIKSKVSHSGLELLDVSPFKPGRPGTAQMPQQDGIAIVGMGIDLPKGKGPQQLWETLSKGVSTVEEVRFGCNFHTYEPTI